MSSGSRKVRVLYARYGEQVLEILHHSSSHLTQEERRSVWEGVWKEAMCRKRELSSIKREKDRQIWLLTIVRRNLKEMTGIYKNKTEQNMID